MLLQPIRQRSFATDLSEVELSRIFISLRRQIRPVVSAHAADFVAAAASQAMKECFGFEQAGRAGSRTKEFIDRQPLSVRQIAEGGKPRA